MMKRYALARVGGVRRDSVLATELFELGTLHRGAGADWPSLDWFPGLGMVFAGLGMLSAGLGTDLQN